ncbi:MAG: phosphatidate cytidylyltransferase, partial [Acidimicrobiales bacterium]
LDPVSYDQVSYDQVSYDQVSYDQVSYDQVSYDQVSYDDPARGGGGPPEAGAGERITVAAHQGPDLPHWADPPTGEVPRIVAGGLDTGGGDEEEEAWQALASGRSRWRGEAGDWDDVEDLGALGDDDTRVGALDDTRSAHSDLYSFDEDFERLEEERSGSHPAISVGDPLPGGFVDAGGDPDVLPDRPGGRTRLPVPGRRSRPAAARPGVRARPSRGDPAGRTRFRGNPARGAPGRGNAGGPPGGGSRDTGTATLVGGALVALLLVLYAVGPVALVILSGAVVGASAAEGYGMLQRAGFRPATLLGLVSSVAVVFAAYWKGIDALPLVVFLSFAASMLWYLLGIVEARPLANVAVTNLMFVWVGVLGSFGALMLRAHDGRGLFLGAIITTVGADIAAFAVGRQVGNRQMAPAVSPGKTWEGAAAGLVGALVVGAVVGKTVAPWGGIKHGLVLGLLIGVIGPIGDLAESMVKRDLGIKDSGKVLPGHGGLLDRFDSILLILPAAYYLASYSHILKL